MHFKSVKIVVAVALWVCLFSFLCLQIRAETPVILLLMCVCMSLSLGILATFALLLQAHRLAESVREMRALCQGLFLCFFLMGMFVPSLLSENLRQGTWATGLTVMVMGFGVIGSAVWVVILGMRALQAVERKPEEK